MKLSAVICTHNPRRGYLDATLASLRSQDMCTSSSLWELIVIDNRSETPLAGVLDLSWHKYARIVREDKLGLTFARLRSLKEAKGDIIVFIDDDNVLERKYIRNVCSIFANYPEFGAIGGKSLPVYEVEPPAWFAETGLTLACRDLGDQPLAASWPDPQDPRRTYPKCAPIGAGMAVRRKAYEGYVRAAAEDPRRTGLGRRGTDLASGEDNDMVLSILEQGWGVAYRPELSLQHLIPASRLTQDYLERYSRSSNRTWVQVLDVHGVRPWTPIPPWTLPLRLARAFAMTQPWRSPAAAIRFMGQRGLFEGRAAISV